MGRSDIFAGATGGVPPRPRPTGNALHPKPDVATEIEVDKTARGVIRHANEPAVASGPVERATTSSRERATSLGMRFVEPQVPDGVRPASAATAESESPSLPTDHEGLSALYYEHKSGKRNDLTERHAVQHAYIDSLKNEIGKLRGSTNPEDATRLASLKQEHLDVSKAVRRTDAKVQASESAADIRKVAESGGGDYEQHQAHISKMRRAHEIATTTEDLSLAKKAAAAAAGHKQAALDISARVSIPSEGSAAFPCQGENTCFNTVSGDDDICPTCQSKGIGQTPPTPEERESEETTYTLSTEKSGLRGGGVPLPKHSLKKEVSAPKGYNAPEGETRTKEDAAAALIRDILKP